MPRYNVVFIIVDSWNRNFVGIFNQEAKNEGLTPNIDSFSQGCQTFSSAYSAGLRTAVSVISILSGCCPCRYGDWYKAVSPKRTMLSQMLKKFGYTTYGFTSNPCTSRWRKFEKGFDVFRDDGVILKDLQGPLLDFMLVLKTLIRNPYDPAEQINSRIFPLFKKDSLPYFLSVHYMDIHGPYIPKNGFKFLNRMAAGRLWEKATIAPGDITPKERERLIAVYKKQMKYLDFHIGSLLKEVDNDKTVVVITSDHGDVFGTRGYYGHPDVFCKEMMNVPLFIKLPPEMKIEGRIIDCPVSLMDLVPTVLDILGVNVEIDFDGNSLLPLMRGEKEKYQTKYIISEQSRKYASVIKDRWKLTVNYADSNFELYDLKEDKEDRNNLVNKHVDVRNELEGIIKEHIWKNRRVC